MAVALDVSQPPIVWLSEHRHQKERVGQPASREHVPMSVALNVFQLWSDWMKLGERNRVRPELTLHCNNQE